MLNRLLQTLVVAGLLMSATQTSYAADCAKAKEYFDKGLNAGKQSNWAEAKTWLGKSIAECNQFDNWYLLGQSEQELKNYSAAATAFEDARRYANNSDERAIAIGRYAEVLIAQGKSYEPLTLLHEARKLHSNPPQWITQLARDLDVKRANQPMTVAQVTEGLNNRSIQLLDLNTKPSINVTINFLSNSTNVTSQSETNVDVLAKALQDPSFADKTVWIIGHSDKRGDDTYNLKLSKKRAESVTDTLVQLAPKLKGKIRSNGVGEQRPLYEGDTEDVNLLNRRIEVMID